MKKILSFLLLLTIVFTTKSQSLFNTDTSENKKSPVLPTQDLVKNSSLNYQKSNCMTNLQENSQENQVINSKDFSTQVESKILSSRKKSLCIISNTIDNKTITEYYLLTTKQAEKLQALEGNQYLIKINDKLNYAIDARKDNDALFAVTVETFLQENKINLVVTETIETQNNNNEKPPLQEKDLFAPEKTQQSLKEAGKNIQTNSQEFRDKQERTEAGTNRLGKPNVKRLVRENMNLESSRMSVRHLGNIGLKQRLFSNPFFLETFFPNQYQAALLKGSTMNLETIRDYVTRAVGNQLLKDGLINETLLNEFQFNS